MTRAVSVLGLALGATIALLSGAAAQDYPARTVKIIVPFAAGGSADAVPRVVADWLSRKWGQTIIIENRTGAAGNIGAEAVFKRDGARTGHERASDALAAVILVDVEPGKLGDEEAVDADADGADHRAGAAADREQIHETLAGEGHLELIDSHVALLSTWQPSVKLWALLLSAIAQAAASEVPPAATLAGVGLITGQSGSCAQA